VDSPDKNEKVCVLAGAVYKIKVDVSSSVTLRPAYSVEACLDTGGGCNLIRRDTLPPTTSVQPLSEIPRISAAQGEYLSIRGFCQLFLQAGEQRSAEPTDFLVVDDLVVPLLLGTPLDRYPCISNRTSNSGGTIGISWVPPGRVSLFGSIHATTIRVRTPQTLPAFSETLVEVTTNRSGLSLLRPSRQRTEYAQIKNGVADLPASGHVFKCWVANFSNHPLHLRKGQVVGIAENQDAAKICVVSTDTVPTSVDDDWTFLVSEQIDHLSREQQHQLLETLRPHAKLWDGRLGKNSGSTASHTYRGTASLISTV
jgi:hypothetical protein